MSDLRAELENLVEAARANDHPLHSHFEWDDQVASEAYRLFTRDIEVAP